METEAQNPQSSDAEKAYSQQCPYCTMSFTSANSLRTHIGHHNRKGETESSRKSFGSPPRTQSSPKKRKRKFKTKWSSFKTEKISCDICGKWFSSRYALLRHNSMHTGARPYKCPTCDKAFTTKWYLQMMHKCMGPSSNGALTCGDCNQSFEDEASLKDHVCNLDNEEVEVDIEGETPLLSPKVDEKVTGTDAQPNHLGNVPQQTFSCRVCNQTFASFRGLGGHMKAHTLPSQRASKTPEKKKSNESPEKSPKVSHYTEIFCPVCSKSFKYKGSLKNHMLSHLDAPGPARCPLCPEEYPNVQLLIIHLKYHSHDCPVCNKSFEYPSQLEQHQKQDGHFMPAPEFCCSICKKTFTDESLLSSHMLSHHADNAETKPKQPDYNAENQRVDTDLNPTVYPETNHVFDAIQDEPLDMSDKSSLDTSNSRKSPRERPPHSCFTCDTDCALRAALKSPTVLNKDKLKQDPGEGSSGKYLERKPSEIKSSDNNAISEQPSEEGLLACPVCGKLCQKGLSFIRHKAWHKRRQDIIVPIKRRRRSTSIYSCPVCDKKYTESFNMKRHMKVAHGPESIDMLKGPEYTETTLVSDHGATGVAPNHGTTGVVTDPGATGVVPDPETTGDVPDHRTTGVVPDPVQENHGEEPPKKRKRSISQSQSVPDQNSATDHTVTDSNSPDIQPQKKMRTAPTSQKGIFRCPVCAKIFTWYGNMRCHLKKFHTDKVNQPKTPPKPRPKPTESNDKCSCTICGKEFLNRSGLGMHMTIHATSTVQVQAGTNKSPEKTESFPCLRCGKIFSCEKNLKLHKVRAHKFKKSSSGEDRFFCPICNQGFHYNCRLKRHMEMFHKSENALIAKTQLVTRSFYCRYCPRRFTNSGTLKNHENAHIRKRDSERMPPLVNNDSSEPFISKLPSGLYSCVICKKTYVDKANLQRHIRLQEDHRIPSEQMTSNQVNEEAQITEPDPAPQTPAEVPEMKKTPVNGYPLCTFCGKTFQCQSFLERHLRTHTGERPFQCHVCPNTFKRKEALKIHLARVHPNFKQAKMSTGNRRHRCVCNKEFLTHFSLGGHMRHCAIFRSVQADKKNVNDDVPVQEQVQEEYLTPREEIEIETLSVDQDAVYPDRYNAIDRYGQSSRIPEADIPDRSTGYGYSRFNNYPQQNDYTISGTADHGYHGNVLGQGAVHVKEEPQSDSEEIVEYEQYEEVNEFVKEEPTAERESMDGSYIDDSTADSASDVESVLSDPVPQPSTSFKKANGNDAEENPLIFKLLSRRGLINAPTEALATIRQSVFHQRTFGKTGFVLGSIHAPVIDSGQTEGDVVGYLIGHPNGFGPFSCPICYRRFPTPSAFADHLMFHTDRCPDAGLLANVFRPAGQPIKPDDCDCHLFGLSFTECPKCVMGFTNLDELKRHVKLHVERYIEHQIANMDL